MYCVAVLRPEPLLPALPGPEGAAGAAGGLQGQGGTQVAATYYHSYICLAGSYRQANRGKVREKSYNNNYKRVKIIVVVV